LLRGVNHRQFLWNNLKLRYAQNRHKLARISTSRNGSEQDSTITAKNNKLRFNTAQTKQSNLTAMVICDPLEVISRRESQPGSFFSFVQLVGTKPLSSFSYIRLNIKFAYLMKACFSFCILSSVLNTYAAFLKFILSNSSSYLCNHADSDFSISIYSIKLFFTNSFFLFFYNCMAWINSGDSSGPKWGLKYFLLSSESSYY